MTENGTRMERMDGHTMAGQRSSLNDYGNEVSHEYWSWLQPIREMSAAFSEKARNRLTTSYHPIETS